jgi:hypothetical protein
MIVSTLLVLSVATLLGRTAWTQARAQASLQPVRVRADRARRSR